MGTRATGLGNPRAGPCFCGRGTSVTFDAAWSLVADAVSEGRIPGAVFGVSDGGERRVAWAGHAMTQPERVPMARDTVFDLASVTKPVFTTERILSHAASGRIDLDAPVTSVIPDFRQYDVQCWERRVTLRDCLGHQTPFPAVEPIYTYGDERATLRAFVLQREWRRLDVPVYSDINFVLLGIALERLEGRGIRDMDPGAWFTFAPDPDATAATEACTWRGRVMRGEVHDENCYALQGAGHSGLFGSAEALLEFSEAAFARGPGLITTPLSATRTHGWERRHPGWSGGQACTAETIGHTGFTGTGLWLDFGAGRAWTLLTNRVHPTRHADTGIGPLRQAVGETLYRE
ncbi:class A beta-lactamase-related serine hydrolase [Rhodophyticola sp. CCM32]|uniref:serine hydrolase domain-containing protein n=1 Tax=Rhodophyticola sp. CCM32 TaxID=2916397 RepID=UPI00107FC3C6|nr:serine hydrolase domain-containing protein [Rhodophyticola sp. CCM32]QBY02467.1 class A beta-lactamase-related serine hydrolase [Rhodophyticola sp. CCM32]